MGKGSDRNSNTDTIAQHQLINLRGRQDSESNLQILGLGIQCENVVMLIGYAMMTKTWTVVDQHSSVLDTLVSCLQWD